jgi:hypothetical protein
MSDPTFLDSLIKSMKKEKDAGKEDLVILRQYCDQIYTEEHNKHTPENKIWHEKHTPKGPNILLCLPVPGRNSKEVGYLALEREFYSERVTKTDTNYEFLIVYWAYKKYTSLAGPHVSLEEPPKKIKVIKVPDVTPLKVLSFYAKTISHFRGE